MKPDKSWIGWAAVVPIRIVVIAAELLVGLGLALALAPIVAAFAKDGHRIESAWVLVRHVLNLSAVIPWWPWQGEEKNP